MVLSPLTLWAFATWVATRKAMWVKITHFGDDKPLLGVLFYYTKFAMTCLIIMLNTDCQPRQSHRTSDLLNKSGMTTFNNSSA